MPKNRVLVIEDDAAIRGALLDVLEVEHYATLSAADGDSGLAAALAEDYDLLLLDLVLPHRSGLEILEAVRGARPTTPVIVLTALGSEDDRIRGLKLGADDYVVKPFSMQELLARVEAVLRRSPERPVGLEDLSVPGGQVRWKRRTIEYDDGEASPFSEREAELLHYLASNPGRAISRDELLSRVWRLDPKAVMTRTIDMHIARLREKLREDTTPRLIVTVRGQGYCFAESAP